MGKPQFTPGSWRWVKDNGSFYFVKRGGDDDGWIVATGGVAIESEANAHLIAAAPDLYAALKAFVDAGDGHDDFEDEWPAARAALAKATGASNG